jgi:VWFA-related protein
MSKTHGIVLLLLLCCAPTGFAQESSAPTGGPAKAVAAPAAVGARISLDVLVTDKAGKLVPELEPTDFSLLDNGLPRKIAAFRRTDGVAGNRFDPPVEVIIVLDAVNMPYQAITQLRLQLQKFLRQNDGHLAQPVSIFVFTDDGLKVQPAPSKDGNALATMLNTSVGSMRAMGSAGGDYGLAEQFTKSIQALRGIAANEARKPGRKLLVWLGNGWPLLDTHQFIKSNEGEQRYFSNIVDLSKGLREARITVYGIYMLNSAADQFLWQAYLKPVKEFHKADAGNLSMQVLAQQSGGRVLQPSNDIAGQIDNCITDVGAYYTLTFLTPPAAQANEYHDLKVVVDKPELSVRTTSGYYDQP